MSPFEQFPASNDGEGMPEKNGEDSKIIRRSKTDAQKKDVKSMEEYDKQRELAQVERELEQTDPNSQIAVKDGFEFARRENISRLNEKQTLSGRSDNKDVLSAVRLEMSSVEAKIFDASIGVLNPHEKEIFQKLVLRASVKISEGVINFVSHSPLNFIIGPDVRKNDKLQDFSNPFIRGILHGAVDRALNIPKEENKSGVMERALDAAMEQPFQELLSSMTPEEHKILDDVMDKVKIFLTTSPLLEKEVRDYYKKDEEKSKRKLAVFNSLLPGNLRGPIEEYARDLEFKNLFKGIARVNTEKSQVSMKVAGRKDGLEQDLKNSDEAMRAAGIIVSIHFKHTAANVEKFARDIREGTKADKVEVKKDEVSVHGIKSENFAKLSRLVIDESGVQ